MLKKSSITFVRFSKFFLSAAVHQLRKFPVLSELCALVVEAVRHFVADNHTDRAIVGCIVSLQVKERRLENGCREADLVGVGL